MTFSQFLQVLAFSLLSNTIPLCIFLYVTAYIIKVRLVERKEDNKVEKKRKTLADED